MRQLLVLIVLLQAEIALAQKENSPLGMTVNNTSRITCGNLMFRVPESWKLEPDGSNYV